MIQNDFNALYMIMFYSSIPVIFLIIIFQIPLSVSLYFLPRKSFLAAFVFGIVHFLVTGFIFIDLAHGLFSMDAEFFVYFGLGTLVAVGLTALFRSRRRRRTGATKPATLGGQLKIISWTIAACLPLILIFAPVFSHIRGETMFAIFGIAAFIAVVIFFVTGMMRKADGWSALQHFSIACLISITFCTVLAYGSGLYAQQKFRAAAAALEGNYTLTSGNAPVAGPLDMTIFNMRPEMLGFFTESLSFPAALLQATEKGEPFYLYWSWPQMGFVTATELAPDSPC